MDAISDGLKCAMGVVEHGHVHTHTNIRSVSRINWSCLPGEKTTPARLR
jgi:hypothetical protein